MAERLNPVFQIEGRRMVLLTPELAGVSRRILDGPVASLADERASIVAALDLLVVGI